MQVSAYSPVLGEYAETCILFVRRTRPEVGTVWFRVLSSIVAAALLGKATIALALPRRFYAMRERQYASESLPPKLLVAPAVVATLTFVAWYATIFHYQQWGWVVTGFLTSLLCMGVDHVFRWKKSPQKDAPGGQESEGRLGGLHTALSGRGVFGVGLPGILSPNAQSEFRRTIACTGAGGRAGFQWRVVTAGPVMRNVRLGARHVAMDAYLQLLCVDSLVAMDVQLTLQSGARHLACDSMRLGNILWVHDAVRLVPSRLCHG